MIRPGIFSTIGDARRWLAENKSKGRGVTCPACQQHVQVYRRSINAGVARVLIALYRNSVGITEGGWYYIPDLRGIEKGGDTAKARYWNLIEPMPDVKRGDGSYRTGWWRLTYEGMNFVRGRMSIPKYALVYNGECLGLEGERVSIYDALGKKFNYDDLMNGR